MRLFFTMLLTCQCLLLQAEGDYFNSEAAWQKMQLQQGALPKLFSTDTFIIVASNRKLDTTLRYALETREDSGVHYFLVLAKGGKWLVYSQSSLAQSLSATKGDNNRNWVIYTEGMGKLFTTDVDRGMAMASQYGVRVLLLDYPSISTTRKSLGNYFFAIKNARRTPRYFLPVIDSFRLLQPAMLPDANVHLFFHSMGNNLMRGIARSKELECINSEVWADNLILNAACVKQGGHHKWMNKVKFAQYKYIHYNPQDRTLFLAHLVSKKRQLGERVRKPLAANTTYINFNTLTGERGHSNFLNLTGRKPIPSISYEHYGKLFNSQPLNLNDTTVYKPSAYRGIGYDILPPAQKTE